MAPSQSIRVAKPSRGTVPHGIDHIRVSLGHPTRHEQSAWAIAADVNNADAARRPANRVTACTCAAKARSALSGLAIDPAPQNHAGRDDQNETCECEARIKQLLQG